MSLVLPLESVSPLTTTGVAVLDKARICRLPIASRYFSVGQVKE